MDISIRTYHPGDLEACRVLWEALTQHHRDLYQDPSLGSDNPGFYFDRHLARVGSDHIWVAVYDGKVIGLVGLILGEQEAEVEPFMDLKSDDYITWKPGPELYGYPFMA